MVAGSIEGLFYLTTSIFGFFAAAYLAFSVSKTRVGGLHKTILLYMVSIIFISVHILYEGLNLNCTTTGCYEWSGVFGLLAEVGFVIFFYASYKLYYYIKTFDLS
jgi:hypothetical protein